MFKRNSFRKEKHPLQKAVDDHIKNVAYPSSSCNGEAIAFNTKTVLRYARLSSAAYTRSSVPTTAKYYEQLDNDGLNTPAFFVDESDPARVEIIFRGTQSKEDLTIDVKQGVFVDYQSSMMQATIDTLTHKGLLETHILPAIANSKDIVFAGHSLGGAIAAYMVLVLLLNPSVGSGTARMRAYTYGAPAIMPVLFTELTQSFVTAVVFDMDTIPRAPPTTYWCSPGGSEIIHLSVCKDGKTVARKRHWSYFKRDLIGFRTDAKHHSMDNAYIPAIERLL